MLLIRLVVCFIVLSSLEDSQTFPHMKDLHNGCGLAQTLASTALKEV